ncbi:cytochrome P450 [Nemania sp. FL0031]|nr:cytochrome P450 [Nemania sp. FL0031]
MPLSALWVGGPWACLVLLFSIVHCSMARLVVGIVYNILYHPSAHLPGPKLATISNVSINSIIYWFLVGHQPFKYMPCTSSPVVRVAPIEVSFDTAASGFYDGGVFTGREIHSVMAERQPSVHAEMQQYLSSTFSDRALSEQEYLVLQSVDRFAELLPKRPDDWDVTRVGDLAFGESLNAIESYMWAYSSKLHSWIEMILEGPNQGVLGDVFKRFPTAGRIVTILLHYLIKQLTVNTDLIEDMVIERTQGCTARDSPRMDFVTGLIQNRAENGVAVLQLATHASDLGMYENQVQRLRYLKTVMLEALRIYFPYHSAFRERLLHLASVSMTIVHTNPFSTSMDSVNFQEPTRFMPERWLVGKTLDTLDVARRFSLGSKTCMGKRDSRMNTFWQKPKIIVYNRTYQNNVRD